MKEKGIATGGRVFFVDSDGLDMNALVSYLQREPVIITGVGKCIDVDSLPAGAA